MQHGALLVSSSRQMPSQKIHRTAMSEMNNSAEKILFDLGGRVYLIKAVAGLFIPAGVALMIGSFWALTSLSALYGSLEPLESRIIFFIFLLATGLLMSFGFWMFLKLYVLRISQINDQIGVTTTRVLMDVTETFQPSQVGIGRRHEGNNLIGANLTPTPFHTLSIEGRRLPLILDKQAAFFDIAAIERLRRG
jgi:hypothetical protein